MIKIFPKKDENSILFYFELKMDENNVQKAKKNDFPRSYNFFTGLGWYGNFLSKPGFWVSGPVFNLSRGCQMEQKLNFHR